MAKSECFKKTSKLEQLQIWLINLVHAFRIHPATKNAPAVDAIVGDPPMLSYTERKNIAKVGRNRMGANNTYPLNRFYT